LGVSVEWSTTGENIPVEDRTQVWYVGYSVGAEVAAYGSPTKAYEIVRRDPDGTINWLPDAQKQFSSLW
jgi:hypothetical protein